MFKKIKKWFCDLFKEEPKKAKTGLIEMTDDELSQVVGQAGGLFLTESFGFTVGPEVTNNELRNLINNNLAELNNTSDPQAILNMYMTMAKVMNDEQVNEFTRIMIEQVFRGALQEVQNLCEIAGLRMIVHNYDINVSGNFKVTFHE